MPAAEVSRMAADISVELPAVAQVKLVLMAGIESRLRVLHGGGVTRGMWARASQRLGIDESELSRLRAKQYERFSLEQLVRLSADIGVRITITAE